MQASPDDNISRLQAKARDLLEKSKAKLASQQNGTPKEDKRISNIPFFANQEAPSNNRRDQVIKSKDDKTGLITVDGEKMAELSEKEKWEIRPLLEVFQNEIKENEDVYSEASQQLASRDLAVSIWSLRKELMGNDFERIFDKKNRFIGEE